MVGDAAADRPRVGHEEQEQEHAEAHDDERRHGERQAPRLLDERSRNQRTGDVADAVVRAPDAGNQPYETFSS